MLGRYVGMFHRYSRMSYMGILYPDRRGGDRGDWRGGDRGDWRGGDRGDWRGGDRGDWWRRLEGRR